MTTKENPKIKENTLISDLPNNRIDAKREARGPPREPVQGSRAVDMRQYHPHPFWWRNILHYPPAK